MKYLKTLLIVMLAVFTFGTAMAQEVVVQARVGHSDHHYRHHRHYRRHHQSDDRRQGDDHHR